MYTQQINNQCTPITDFAQLLRALKQCFRTIRLLRYSVYSTNIKTSLRHQWRLRPSKLIGVSGPIYIYIYYSARKTSTITACTSRPQPNVTESHSRSSYRKSIHLCVSRARFNRISVCFGVCRDSYYIESHRADYLLRDFFPGKHSKPQNRRNLIYARIWITLLNCSNKLMYVISQWHMCSIVLYIV